MRLKTATTNYEPDPDLIAFVGEFLRCFGRGIRVKLRVGHGKVYRLTFPEEAPKANEPSNTQSP